MQRGRATEPDEILVDFWKFEGRTGLMWLADLLNNIFKTARMPEAWRWSTRIPLYKNKGNIQSCSNYRGTIEMESKGTTSQPLGNDALGALMARLEAFSRDMKSDHDALRNDRY
ncbi:uncharacterized protein LOC124888828 [Capsicum annuum]|uniref:uncharacterized protein LOC124888828 n=1 Tax=Capsicum annuum TaxID=4072 RepID=UPI001FB0FCCE|nr:uncharacterized protein LOC124888828 [Capsicum annuum]